MGTDLHEVGSFMGTHLHEIGSSMGTDLHEVGSFIGTKLHEVGSFHWGKFTTRLELPLGQIHMRFGSFHEHTFT